MLRSTKTKAQEATVVTTQDFITELFCLVDDAMTEVEKHPQAELHPSEVATLALLFASKGVGNRAFYRWLERDFKHLFPRLPERTRLFRLFVTHREWAQRFLASPTILGVIDAYGIELIHPMREGRTPHQIGRKGLSNHRWIVGGKLCLLLNKLGLVVGSACDTANVSDTVFQPLIKQYQDEMIVCADTGFHAKAGDPKNLKVCPRGTWNSRMMVETVLSMLTLVNHFKKVMHRVWRYFEMRLGWTMAAFNILAKWHGLEPDEEGVVHLSIAEFSL
jgi:hypothetical protein